MSRTTSPVPSKDVTPIAAVPRVQGHGAPLSTSEEHPRKTINNRASLRVIARYGSALRNEASAVGSPALAVLDL
jgi:hypothetical protein